MFHVYTEFYNQLKQKEEPINKAKPYDENIGRRHVTYRQSPNGTVEVAVATTDTPFRIERDEDVSAHFAFLGQVRDKLYTKRHKRTACSSPSELDSKAM